MKTTEQICQELVNGLFEFSRHAFKRAIERNISEREIREAAANAQMVSIQPDLLPGRGKWFLFAKIIVASSWKGGG